MIAVLSFWMECMDPNPLLFSSSKWFECSIKKGCLRWDWNSDTSSCVGLLFDIYLTDWESAFDAEALDCLIRSRASFALKDIVIILLLIK